MCRGAFDRSIIVFPTSYWTCFFFGVGRCCCCLQLLFGFSCNFCIRVSNCTYEMVFIFTCATLSFSEWNIYGEWNKRSQRKKKKLLVMFEYMCIERTKSTREKRSKKNYNIKTFDPQNIHIGDKRKQHSIVLAHAVREKIFYFKHNVFCLLLAFFCC